MQRERQPTRQARLSFVPDAPLPSWFIMQPDGTDLRSLPQLRGAADPLDWVQPKNGDVNVLGR
jgi:hypothetical protein